MFCFSKYRVFFFHFNTYHIVMECFFRIAIVENEKADSAKLFDLLERYFAQQTTTLTHDVKVYQNAFDFIDEANQYNLVFMDIEMPGITGLEASFKVREKSKDLPLIIFVTNMAQFAIDGYKVNALDFCLKPITYEDLFIPMEKARAVLMNMQERVLTIKTRSEILRLRVSLIQYIEMIAHDIHIVYQTDEGEEKDVRYRGSLKAFEENLEGTTLVRINSGCFINVNYFASFNASQSSVELKNGAVLALSRSNKRSFLNAITRSGI